MSMEFLYKACRADLYMVFLVNSDFTITGFMYSLVIPASKMIQTKIISKFNTLRTIIGAGMMYMKVVYNIVQTTMAMDGKALRVFQQCIDSQQ